MRSVTVVGIKCRSARGANIFVDAAQREQAHKETNRIDGETTMIRKIVAVLLTLSALGALSGCNTIAGLGKDLERGGEVVQDAAKKVQKKL